LGNYGRNKKHINSSGKEIKVPADLRITLKCNKIKSAGKITNLVINKNMELDERYLKGLVDMAISNYEQGNGTIPAEFGLLYEFEYGVENRGEMTIDEWLKNTETKSVKIKFSWVVEGERVATGDEEFPYENKQIPMDDYFTLIASDSVSKLQSYVEDVLDNVIGQE